MTQRVSDMEGDTLATKADVAELMADLTRRLVLAMLVQVAIFTAIAVIGLVR